VLREAEKLVKAGVKELLVISQDTSRLRRRSEICREPLARTATSARSSYDLARELGSLGAWVRLHYVYPYPHVDEVIQLMAEGKILPYLDIPFQHASPNVLKRMKPPGLAGKDARPHQEMARGCPDLAIRSTFIVGFPGETEEDFEIPARLAGRSAKLDRVGASNTSRSRAPANEMGLVFARSAFEIKNPNNAP
jgi:ribosomal protein S12 methylthiotransferase